MTAPISNGPTTTRLHHYAGHYCRGFVWGEFCPGWVHRGRLLGEFCTGLARRVSCGESFVPEVVLCAVQSSPCSACLCRRREEVLPASEKWLGIAVLWCVGRVLSRGGPSGPPAGRVLYRFDPPGFVWGKFCPASGPVCGTKFSLQARNGLVSPFCGVLGEFCPGWAHRGRLLGEFYTGLARRCFVWGKFCPGWVHRGRLLGEFYTGSARRCFVWGEFCPGCAFDVRSRGSFVPLIG